MNIWQILFNMLYIWRFPVRLCYLSGKMFWKRTMFFSDRSIYISRFHCCLLWFCRIFQFFRNMTFSKMIWLLLIQIILSKEMSSCYIHDKPIFKTIELLMIIRNLPKSHRDTWRVNEESKTEFKYFRSFIDIFSWLFDIDSWSYFAKIRKEKSFSLQT